MRLMCWRKAVERILSAGYRLKEIIDGGADKDTGSIEPSVKKLFVYFCEAKKFGTSVFLRGENVIKFGSIRVATHRRDGRSFGGF